MKKLNNKGFSLVELIIVIAIMVILVAVLAPQFTKWIERSRVSTDIQSASEIATAVQVAVAEGKTITSGTISTLVSNLDSVAVAPKVKSKAAGYTAGGANDFYVSITEDATTKAVTIKVYGGTTAADAKELFPNLGSDIEPYTK